MCLARSFFSRTIEAQLATGATHDMRIFTGSAALATPTRPSAQTPESAILQRRIVSSQFRRLARWLGKRLVLRDCRRSNDFWQGVPAQLFARHPVQRERDRRSAVDGALLLAIGPQAIARQRDRRRAADVVARGGAELEHFQAAAKQLDVVNRLRALVAAVDYARLQAGAVGSADGDVFRPQRDAYFVARPHAVQQRRLEPAAVGDLDHADIAVALDQNAGELVGGAG